MRAGKTLLTLLMVVFVAMLAGRAVSQDEKNAAPAKTDGMAEMMKRWQEVCTPNEHHQKLAQFIGEWKTETRMWMQPGAEPTVSEGTAKFHWLSEGRWLAQDLDSEMMGMPYHGFGITGYDNFKKKYVGSWVDSMSTALITMEGNLDHSGKTMLMYGLMDEPMTGEHDKTVKYVTRWVSDDKFVFEIHDMSIGETNTKVMEVTYTRKKSS